MWNDTEGMALIRNHYPWFYKHIGAFKTGVEKADIMRYFILYHHGGVYADLDMECLRPWEPLLQVRARPRCQAPPPPPVARTASARMACVCAG